MPSVIPFFEKAEHRLSILRQKYGTRPRLAAFKLGIWAISKALHGFVLSDVVYTTRRTGTEGPIKLAVMLRGGIGDEVMSLAYVYELIRFSGVCCMVDIYSSCSVAALEAICHKQDFIVSIRSIKAPCNLEEYDAALDILRHAQVKALCKPRLERVAPALAAYLDRLVAFQSAHKSWYTDENQAMGIHYSDVRGTFRRGQADFDSSLGLKDSQFTLNCKWSFEDIAQKFGLESGYITLQREAGANPKSTKLWAAKNYTELLRQLVRRFPARQLVLIGVEKNFIIPEECTDKILDLRGKTDFGEFMAIVKYARLHIGCEGIVPHLRHYLHGGPAVILFGPSAASMLNYPENIACSGKECSSGCEGILISWQDECLKGYDYCHSIAEIRVEDVMNKVAKVLKTFYRFDNAEHG